MHERRGPHTEDLRAMRPSDDLAPQVADVWDEVRYCSDRCRRARSSSRADRLEAALLDRAAAARRGATFCPSEVARAIAPEEWRPLMEPVRAAARRLVARGRLEMLQSGRRVDPSTAKGPIRLRRIDGDPSNSG